MEMRRTMGRRRRSRRRWSRMGGKTTGISMRGGTKLKPSSYEEDDLQDKENGGLQKSGSSRSLKKADKVVLKPSSYEEDDLADNGKSEKNQLKKSGGSDKKPNNYGHSPNPHNYGVSP